MVFSEEDIKYRDPKKACFACPDPYQHPREWKPDPDSPERHGRTLVLCFDGTGDSFDKDNSNVVQFLAMLKKDDPEKQLVYYQSGIGTYTTGSIKILGIERLSKLRDEMTACSFEDHVKEGYKFLMEKYRFGDQICIFGFSRGAYTARALAGMLQKIGLLPSHNLEQLPFAFAMYDSKDDAEGLGRCVQFKRTLSIDVKIEFLGVWDTVESVGLIPKELPFSSSGSAIVYFRHALALDEHRVKFIPSFYGQTYRSNWTHRAVEEHKSEVHGIDDSDVQEVFFAGAHCDVGGGSVPNGERHSLARISLRWMIRECFKVKTGIIFDAHMLKHQVGLDINSDAAFDALQSLPPLTDHSTKAKPDNPVSLRQILGSPFRRIQDKLSQTGPLKSIFDHGEFVFTDMLQEELNDSRSPIHDQLKKHTYWKVMEWVPWVIGKKYARLDCGNASWYNRFIWNRGRGRIVVMKRGVKVHKSVKTRILAGGQGGELYRPKARFVIGDEVRRLTREEWLAEKPEHFEWVD